MSRRRSNSRSTAEPPLARALVTGGNGFLASHIVAQLKPHCHVVALDVTAPPAKPPSYYSAPHRFVRGDLLDVPALTALLREEAVDTVFHVAAIVLGDQARLHRVNVAGTAGVIEACRAAGVRRLVYTSSASVTYAGQDVRDATEDAPYTAGGLDPYNESKAAAEKLVLEAADAALLTVAIRPHSIYGPGDPHGWPQIISNARAGKLRWRFTSDQWLSSYTFVENAAYAHLLAAQRLAAAPEVVSGRAYHITDGVDARFWERLYDVAALVQPRDSLGSMRVPLPYSLLYGIAWLCWRAGFPLGTFTPLVLSLASTHHTYSPARARAELGYVPPVDAREAHRRTLAYFRAYAELPAPPAPRSWLLPLLAAAAALLVIRLVFFS